MPNVFSWAQNFAANPYGNPQAVAGGNPNDPNQFLNWPNPAESILKNLYSQSSSGIDADMLRNLQSVLNPYFQNQMGAFNKQMSSAVGTAGRNAGELAASRGYNPASFVSGAQSSARGQFAAQLPQMTAGQMQALLNAAQQAKQYQYQTGAALANFYTNRDQMKTENWWKNQMLEQQPSGWENFFANILPGLGNVAGAQYLG